MIGRPRARGFTLLEMLVSTALLALLVTLAYGSLRVAVQASRSGEALIERTEELRTVQTFLRRQLSQVMMSVYNIHPQSGGEIRFEGSAEAVQFVAPMPGYLSNGGAHVQRFELVSGDNGLQLQFRFAQLNGWDPEAGFPSDIEPVVLIDGINTGRFEFRRLDAEGQLADWSEFWDEPWQLPLLVRLDLQFEADDPRRWPLFAVAALTGGGAPIMGFSTMRPGPGPAPVVPRPREAP